LRILANLTPFIPLSFKGEGEGIRREGFHPSLACTPPSLSKERRKRFIERGFTPLLPALPFP